MICNLELRTYKANDPGHHGWGHPVLYMNFFIELYLPTHFNKYNFRFFVKVIHQETHLIVATLNFGEI